MANKSNGEPLEALTAKLEKNLSDWQKILIDLKAQKVLLPKLQERMDALQASFQHQGVVFDALGRRLETNSHSHAEEIESLRRQILKPKNDLQPIQQQLNELKATILNFQLEQANIQQQQPNKDLNRIIQIELDYKKSITDLDSQNKDLLARIIRQEEEIGILYHKERVQKKAINALWLTLWTAIFSGIAYIVLIHMF